MYFYLSMKAVDTQREIYLNGFAGNPPLLPVSFSDLEKAAEKVMTVKAFAYVAGGAGNERTMNSNKRAFDGITIMPRVLRDVTDRDTSVTLLGKQLNSPFLLAPVGVLELCHRDADLVVARAAASMGVPCVFSNQASVPMETCAFAMGDSPRWFQLYWSKSRELVASFVARAERCGCKAIVITLDTTMLGWRSRDLKLGYLPFLEGKGIAQYTSDPVFQRLMDEPENGAAGSQRISISSVRGLISMVNHYPGSGFFQKLRSGRPLKAVRKFISTYSNPAVTWEDLKFLREHTSLPVILKGILHADDALKAMDHGIEGIWISNHGGRQIDGAISSVEALVSIAHAVKGRIPIIVDSGIRGGADAFKALALGANAVAIGRPYAYALAVAGEKGVRELLRNYMAEFELTMALSGCRSVNEIGSHCVIREV